MKKLNKKTCHCTILQPPFYDFSDFSQPMLLFLAYFLTQSIMPILSKGCKQDNFESHNSLKLNCSNIWGVHSNFVECESFLESNSPKISALCETKLDDSIDFCNSSVRDLLLIWNHMILLLICIALQFMWRKDFLFFPQDFSIENSVDFY